MDRHSKDAVIGKDDLDRFLLREFGVGFYADSGLAIEHVWHGRALVRQHYAERLTRPGGTISGPAMMALADFAFFVALLGAIGPVAHAVTTNLNINFLRRPKPCDVLADARVLRQGKRLAVLEATIYSEGDDEPVAHATSTYSIPPGT